MKQNLHALILSFFTIVGIGQSKNSLQLHLTKDKLETSNEFKKQANSKEEVHQERFINFNSVMSFNNDEDYIDVLKNLGDLSQATIFTVYQSDKESKEQELWGIYGEESNISLTTSSIANSDLQTNYKGGFSEIPILNTYTQMYKAKKNNSFQVKPHILIGTISNEKQKAFKGVIAEILIYNKVLRGKKRQAIETALALKYGITLTNGKDYLSSSKKGIYSMKENDGFKHRISGIGRDDDNAFYQKQSHSSAEPSLVTIGVGDIMDTNNDNKSELNNQTFIIWGDNNKNPIIDSKMQSTSQVPLMYRQWKIQVTGKTISELSTTVELDISTFLKEEENTDDYLLVIDRSGNGDFLVDQVKYIEVSTREDNILTFKDVKWDTDGSGSDSFSFALKSEIELTLKEAKPLVCEANNNGILHYQVNGGIPPYHFEFSKDDIIIEQWESTNNKYPDNRIKRLSESKYSLKVIDALQAQIEVDLTLIPPNQITIELGEDRRFSLDDNEIILDASISSDEEISYLWTSDKGFTSSFSRITVTEPGLYTVTATTAKGCSASDTINIKNSLIESFIVFPNQSRDGNYNIKVKLSQKEDIVVRVFDMTGRHLSTIKRKNKSIYSISGKHIPTSGIYNIVLESANQKGFSKLIVN